MRPAPVLIIALEGEAGIPTLGDLASILQLTTGISLAISVFRSPYDRAFNSLGAILDREEAILAGRSDHAANVAAQKAFEARLAWIAKGREIEPKMATAEKWIWASVVLSGAGLLCAALWPAFEVTKISGLIILSICLFPLAYGGIRIAMIINNDLHHVRKQVNDL